MSRANHPITRRLLWNPLLVAFPFSYLIYRTWVGRADLFGWVGLAIVGLWFALSAYDFLSGHRWLDWLYSEELSDASKSEQDEFR